MPSSDSACQMDGPWLYQIRKRFFAPSRTTVRYGWVVPKVLLSKKGFAIAPALDIAALMIDFLPDELDCRCVPRYRLVRQILRFGPIAPVTTEAVDQSRHRGQDLALVIIRKELISLHVVVGCLRFLL